MRDRATNGMAGSFQNWCSSLQQMWFALSSAALSTCPSTLSHRGVLLSIKPSISLCFQPYSCYTLALIRPQTSQFRCYPWRKSCSSACDRSLQPELLHCRLLCAYCQTLSERLAGTGSLPGSAWMPTWCLQPNDALRFKFLLHSGTFFSFFFSPDPFTSWIWNPRMHSLSLEHVMLFCGECCCAQAGVEAMKC